MISLSVQLRDSATPALRHALARLTHRQPLLTVLGKGLETDLKEHFRQRNTEPNKRRWPKQNFWNRIRNATLFTRATHDTATVTIADPAINPHVFGGTITPKESKFLAIPARAEAYGIRPKSGLIPGLGFAVLPRGGPVLIQRAFTPIKLVGRAGSARRRFRPRGPETPGSLVWYWLRRSVRIPRDPRALPATATLQDRLSDRLERWLDRHVIKGGGS
jgi:hypothetical protein